MKIRSLSNDGPEKMMIWFNSLVEEEKGIAENKKVILIEEKQWLKKILQDKNTIFLVGEENDRIIATMSAKKLKRGIDKHVAEVSFGVLRGFEDRVAELIRILEKKCKENGIELLVYYILGCNKRFISIMKNNGFKKVGEISDFYLKDGKYFNRVIMEKIIR